MPSPPDSLVDLLQRRARETPTRRAYTHLAAPETSWSWSRLHQRASAVARWVADQGGFGAPVLLQFEEGLDFLAALYGCMMAGALAVPVHPPDPSRPERTQARLTAICEDAGIRLLLTHRPVLSAVQAARAAIPSLRTLPLIPVDTLPDTPFDGPRPQPDDLAYLQYTSGSTTTPRGVQISHRNLMYQLTDFDTGFAHTPASVLVSWLPATHDLGLVYGRFMVLFIGCHGVFLSPGAFLRDPVRWLRAIHQHRGTHTAAPNFGYDLVASRISPEQAAALDLSSLRVALNGAEAIRIDSERRFQEALEPAGLSPLALTHAMGMSEATAKVITEPIDRIARFLHIDREALQGGHARQVPASSTSLAIASCGRPLHQTRICVVDPKTRQPLPDDQVGELWVAGPTVAQGYHQRPDETERTFRAYTSLGDGPWLRTGDLAFTHRGEVYLTGRLKDLLILRGQNHHPEDLEWTVQGCHPALRPGAIVAYPSTSPTGEGLGLAAEVRPENLRPDEVFAALREAIGRHGLAPSQLALLPPRTLPKTTSGKLQRRATALGIQAGTLPILARWEAPARSESAPPRSPPTLAHLLQQASPRRRERLLLAHLCEITAGLLGMDPDEVDTDEPLHALGLDSVTAVQMVEQVGRDLDHPLPGTVLFDHPTLDDLARWLATELGPSTPSK